MTAPINIENIFPSFELLTASNNPDSDTGVDEAGVLDATQAEATATLASGAVSDASINNAGSFFTTNPIVTVAAPSGGVSAQTNSTGTFTITGIPQNGRKVTIDGNDISFGDVASGAGEVKTDIVGSSAVTNVDASGTLSVNNGVTGGSTVTIGTTVFTEGASADWTYGGSNSGGATSLASAINAEGTYSASSTGSIVTVNATGASVATTVSNHGSLVWTSGTLSGGTDAVDAGDAKDDLAASLAQYIRSNINNFSAEADAAVVTVTYTGTNGTDSASPIGDTKTISTDATAISVSGANLSLGAVEKRTAVVTASLYADTDATNRGTIETLTVVDGGSGYSAAPDITLPLPNGNTIEKIGKLGADMVSGGSTFNYAKDYLAIALEDFNINSASGTLANPLSSTESAENSGDYRKLIYHILRKTFDFLNAQESVDTIDVTAGGTGYASTDTVSITGGGGSGATASLTVDGTTGAITVVTVTNAGTGYTTIPTVLITTSTGNGALLDLNLSENTPEKFSLQKGFLSENAVNNEVTRDYTTSFTFDESGLEMSPES
jgi:hypothetical protein